MNVILLCAGYATRLYPLTKDQPKPLLPVGGRPILDYLLKKIEEVASVERVILVTNHRFHPHFKRWSEAQRYAWKIEVVDDGTTTNETRLGAIGDLVLVVQKFGIRDDLGVFAGDNLFHSDLKSFFTFAESHRPHASLGVVDVKDREMAKRYGIILVNKERRIVKFLEKPEEPPSTLASTGIYWFPKEGLNLLDRYLSEGHNADRPGDYIGWLVKVDRVYAHPFEGKWFDIGDVDSYQEADRVIRQEEPSQ